MSRRTTLRRLLVLSLALVAHATLAAAQSPAIQYAYDELGRLVAVVDQQGSAAIYVYDAVGNVLSIQRFDAATLPGVAITASSPRCPRPPPRARSRSRRRSARPSPHDRSGSSARSPSLPSLRRSGP